MQVLWARWSDEWLASRKVSMKCPFSGCGCRFKAAITSWAERLLAMMLAVTGGLVVLQFEEGTTVGACEVRQPVINC